MHGGLQNRRFRIVTGRTCSCRGGSKVQHRFRKPIVPTALISPVGDVLASLKLISFETSFQNVTKSEKPLGYEPSIERSSRFGDAYGLVLELDTENRLQICPKGCRFKSDRGLCRLVVQWREQESSKLLIRVRFPAEMLCPCSSKERISVS